MADDKSGLEKGIEIIAKIFTILIPIVLFYFGNKMKEAQDLDYREQQNYNRITTLLKSLSSTSALERKLAIKFSKDLADAGNFPTELLSVIDEVSSTDSTNSKDAQSVLNIVNQKAIAEKDKVVEQKIKEVIESSPTKVYMQIPKGYDMEGAKKLLSLLKSEGYNMLGIESMDVEKSPSANEVRYFKDSDKSKAISISERISKTGIPTNVKLIPGYETKIIGSQLEIWLK